MRFSSVQTMDLVMKIFLMFIFVFAAAVNAQNPIIQKIEPPNWWTDMKYSQIQLMVYGDNLSNIKAESNSKNFKILGTHNSEKKEYAFIDVQINPFAAPHKYEIKLSNESGTAVFEYQILKSGKNINNHKGFDEKDVIYLLMPDRFANGDVENDSISGYADNMQYIPKQGRSGGDLKGIIDHLDYFNDLGVTSLWLTPVLENNTFRSYHGYSATNHYLVDPRLGSNEQYKELVSKAHSQWMKIIYDHVANHISLDHPWMKNLPFADWINGTVENHKRANHNKMVYTDLHADSSTVAQVHEGWFINYMPDLNQSNKFLAKYLIQNTLWWIEFAGIDGIREDTYPYADQLFMSEWAKAILDEYPNFNIVGEVWTGEPAFLAGYQRNVKSNKGYDTNLPSLTDFALRDALVDFLRGRKGIGGIYNVLAMDYLYSDPQQLVTFIDNHDVGRAMFYADSNSAKVKIALHMLFTLRGIPQIFYGIELGMIENEDHGTLRKEFPGGFPSHTRNAFNEASRTEYENDIFNYIKQLIALRKKHESLSTGRLIHFPPDNNVYTYLKILGDEKILNIINANEKEVEVDLTNFGSRVSSSENFFDLKFGVPVSINNSSISVPGMSANAFLISNK